MNDRHPPEGPYPAAPATDADHASYTSYDQQSGQYGNGSYAGYDGYDAYATGSVATSTATFAADGAYAVNPFATSGFSTDGAASGAFAGASAYDSDPLFGDMPGSTPGTDGFGTGGAYGTGQWTDTGSTGADAHGQLSYDPYGAQQQAPQHTDYGTAGYDNGYGTASYAETGSYGTDGQWNANAWAEAGQHNQWGTDPYAAQNAQATQASQPSQTPDAQGFDPGTFEAQQFAAAGYDPQSHQAPGYDQQSGLTHDYTATADGYPAHEYAANGDYSAQGFDPHGYDAQHLEADHFGAQAFDSPDSATTGYETAAFASQPFEAQSYETQAFETQAFEPQAFETQAFPSGALEPELVDYERELAGIDPHNGLDNTSFDNTAFGDTDSDGAEYTDDTDPVHSSPENAYEDGDGHDEDDDGSQDDDARQEHATPPPARRSSSVRSSGPSASRSRRRSPAKRSALLTVAVPSVCVMGVAGVAAASVGGFGGDDKQSSASASEHSVQPSEANNKLDTQLDNLSADTRDFADRASRTQERIDLEAKQEAARKQAAEEAARKERLRPKFALPVTQHGLSAYFGQAGVNWMSVHTGIDFPVAYGTQVMAATDGTVRTQYNSSYGNMAIVTAKDGTQTWYCHLSTYRVSSGSTVKAGDVIAFSGNSGNTTGPHLHFEVRPHGGAAIDPLPWLRSHGLDPT